MRRVLGLALSFVVACSGSPASRSSTTVPPVAAPSRGGSVAADTAPALPDTPLAPQIRKTLLKNGLTVYVMKHAKPEGRAALWLAVNAGSVQEDGDQRGLAHFVEHMAFNGTKRFAKQAIIDYIERIGMRFGPDVNAYTSFDQTVYMLTVPTDDALMMRTGLDILRDWAGDVSFDAEEVEKERGVVLEEWRLRRGAFARIDDKQWPIMFQGSKYAERLPIGLPEILKSAPREALIRFYRDWYRPENMAVIAVGDFDDEAIEKEIASRFGSLVPDPKRRAREPVPVPRTHPLAISLATDPEMPFSQVEIIDKMDHRDERTEADYRRSTVEGVYNSMIRARFSQLALDPESPFMFAGASTSSLTRTADGFTRFANAKAGRTADALRALVREITRVEQHGFSQAELDRARGDELARAEQSAAEWDKAPSDEIADEMTRNFFEREQMPGRAWELAAIRRFLPTITLTELNHLTSAWSGERGRVIAISGPANAQLPTEAEVRSVVATITKEKLTAWVDEAARPLMTKLPEPGRVVSTTADAAAQATVWKLSNGIRVIVKPTTFQNDQIDVEGFKSGGSSTIADPIHARFAAQVVETGGAGDHDPIALRKALAGKVASVDVGMRELSEYASASTRPVDLEVALQLLYLKLTAPRRDERAFAAWKADQLEWARNRKLMPEVSFFDEMRAVVTKGHARELPVTPEMLAKVDLETSMRLWRDRFADLSGFTFVIVGNVDVATLQPLVERYLASLPGAGKRSTFKDVGVAYATGKITKEITRGTEPKSYVSMTFGAPDKWARTSEADAKVLSMVLQIRLREVLREDMGGVYGVSAWVSLERQPKVRRVANLRFGCDPANVEKLRDAALGVIRDIQRDGIAESYLEKVREQLKRSRETDAKENWWWASRLREAYWYGEPFTQVTDLAPILGRATSAHVKAAARRFFDERHMVVGVMRPETAPAP